MAQKYRTLYMLTDNEKQAVFQNAVSQILPANMIQVNQKDWEQLLLRLDQQDEWIRQQDKQIRQLTERIVRLEGTVSRPVNSSQTEVQKPEQKKPAVSVKIDRSAFALLVAGRKIEKEISDSWEVILASIEDGSYREKYQIGNYKPLDLGSEGIIEMQIAGFDAEPLADGSGRAAITWMSRNVLKTKHRMNPRRRETKFKPTVGTGTIGGWQYTEMRKYLDETVKLLIPDIVGTTLKQVKKYSYSMDVRGRSATNVPINDYLWIPSVKEVFGWNGYDERDAVYYQSLFDSDMSRVKETSWWWLRSVLDKDSFNRVHSGGSINYNSADCSGAVVLCFCT